MRKKQFMIAGEEEK